MKSGADEIFVIDEGNLRAVSSRSMREGLLGKSLEDALQTLLQDYPGVIPGAQIDPSAEDPPRFVLLRREAPVGSWSLDHLYVDQYGIPTLVETKLFENPESRREVIGQIIEYAANASKSWASGRARQHAVEYWSKKDQDLEGVLTQAYGDIDVEEFWGVVEANLDQGRIRLIIAADEIRPEVRRMIEYLNSEMQNAEVLGLELKAFGDSSESLVLVPRIVGQTQAEAERRLSVGGSNLWTRRDLSDAFDERSNRASKAMQQLLDWAVASGCLIESRAISPTFGLAGKSKERIASVTSTGHLYLFLDEQKYADGPKERDALLADLKDLGLFRQDLDPADVVSGRNSDMKLSELSDAEFERLTDILARYCT